MRTCGAVARVSRCLVLFGFGGRASAPGKLMVCGVLIYYLFINRSQDRGGLSIRQCQQPVALQEFDDLKC